MVGAITRKTLVELWREPHLPVMAIVFPALLVVLYYQAFGQTQEGLAGMLSVRVVNHDRGAIDAGGRRWNAGRELVDELRNERLDGKAVFDLAVVDDEAPVLMALAEQKTLVLVTVERDFSERLREGRGAPAAEYAIRVTGDRSSPTFSFAAAFLQSRARVYIHQALGLPRGPEMRLEFLPGTGTTDDLHDYVAGLIPFGVMLLILCAATAGSGSRASVPSSYSPA